MWGYLEICFIRIVASFEKHKIPDCGKNRWNIKIEKYLAKFKYTWLVQNEHAKYF